MSPSAKGTHIVSESSNKFNNPRHSNVFAPEAPSIGAAPTPPEPENDQPETPNRRSNKLRNVLIGTGAIAAIGISALVGVNVLGSTAGEKPAEGVSTSAQTNPGEESTNTPVNTGETLTVESIELDPNATPEEWAADYITKIGEWNMAGANQDTADRSLDSSLTINEFAEAEAEKNATIYAEALYGPNWESNPNITLAVTNDTVRNTAYILDYMASLKDEVRFEAAQVVNSATLVSTEGDTSVVNVEYVTTNNAAENSASDEEVSPELVELNGAVYNWNLTFVKSGDHVYLYDFSVN